MLNDGSALSFNKALSEAQNNTETTTVSFAKLLQDVDLAIDNISKLINKSIEDQVSVISSGFLVSQNYTEDNTYFLEDYVGESRTFT